MAAEIPQLEDLFASTGVDPGISSSIIQEGWTIESFGLAATAVAEFDSILPELLPNENLSLLQKARLRAAFVRCQSNPKSDDQPASAQAVPKESSTGSSWTESFAPKLTNESIHDLKSKFLKNYPSELLTQETTPSTRLLSLVHHQLSKQEWKWVPWRYRLSVSKCDELHSQRAAKIPKLEGLSLSALLLDEIPAIEVSNDNMGINAIRTSMDLFNTAMALCNGAHLATLKEYSQKFISLLIQKVAADTGLRTATVLEAQAADRQIWGTIAELVNDRNWTFDNAIHEMTHVRSDLAVLLQLRPKAPKPSQNLPSSSSWQPKGGKGKSKGGGKSKSKSGKGKTTMVTELRQADGSTRQLCINWQHGRCNRSDCKFMHACSYPLQDGNACGKSHTFFQHSATPH